MTPLAGIKVVELARILAGPWAGQVLADLGAEVVKVESPEGDDTRRWGPPFVPNDEGGEDAAYFHATNRGKRSVVADFATGEGRAVVLELVREADVEWGQRMDERPYFERVGAAPHADDPYTVESVRAALSDALDQLEGSHSPGS